MVVLAAFPTLAAKSASRMGHPCCTWVKKFFHFSPLLRKDGAPVWLKAKPGAGTLDRFLASRMGDYPAPQFPSSCGPDGLDLYCSFYSSCVVTETGPRPIFGARHQSALHGVAVHVAEFFCPLLRIPHVEIVVAGLPELGGLLWSFQHLGGSLLNHL